MVTTVAMEVMPSGFTITSLGTQSYRRLFILTNPAAALVQHASHKIKQTTWLEQIIFLLLILTPIVLVIQPLALLTLRRILGSALLLMELNLLLLMHPRRFSSNTQVA